MRRNSIIGRITAGRCFRTAASLFIGLAVTGGLLLLFSFLLVSLDNARSVAPILSLLALCAGAYFSAFYYVSYKRRKGILCGLACGALCYCAVYLVGAVILGAAMSVGLLTRLAAAAACGAVGGVRAANGKRSFRRLSSRRKK